MAHWVVECPECRQDFIHSEIDPQKWRRDPFGEKPEFPIGGARLECPNCRKTAVYQRHQLRYQADVKGAGAV